LSALTSFSSHLLSSPCLCFFFTAPAPPPLSPLSLHDALPISPQLPRLDPAQKRWPAPHRCPNRFPANDPRPRHDLLPPRTRRPRDRKSTRLNSSHVKISYAVFCLKKKNK